MTFAMIITTLFNNIRWLFNNIQKNNMLLSNQYSLNNQNILKDHNNLSK